MTDAATVLTWNLERKRPTSARGGEAVEYLFAQSPDVMVISRSLTADEVWGWPNVINENRLSDHDGAGARLVESRS